MAETDKKQAAFEQKKAAMLEQLSSEKATQRRQAAYFVGEASVEEAITQLRTMYYDDPDARVREAAGYALGMFQAIKQADANDEQEKLEQYVMPVLTEGKLGRRRRFKPGRLVRLLLLLLVSFGLLAGANVVVLSGTVALPTFNLNLGGGGADNNDTGETDSTAVAAVPDRDRAALINASQTYLNQIRGVGATLQTVLAERRDGADLNCSAIFQIPSPLELTESEAAAQPDLSGVIAGLNSARDQIVSGHQRWEQACFAQQPIAPDEAASLLGTVEVALNALQQIEPTIPQAAQPTSAAAAGAGETTPVAPTAPTSEPTPNTGAVTALTFYVDRMTADRGPATLLRQYWNDALVNPNGRAGCDVARPPIPSDAELNEAVAGAAPELAEAVVQVQIGLGLLRQGWQLFENSCAAGTLGQNALRGQEFVETAISAFNNADLLLSNLAPAAP